MLNIPVSCFGGPGFEIVLDDGYCTENFGVVSTLEISTSTGKITYTDGNHTLRTLYGMSLTLHHAASDV